MSSIRRRQRNVLARAPVDAAHAGRVPGTYPILHGPLTSIGGPQETTEGMMKSVELGPSQRTHVVSTV